MNWISVAIRVIDARDARQHNRQGAWVRLTALRPGKQRVEPEARQANQDATLNHVGGLRKRREHPAQRRQARDTPRSQQRDLDDRLTATDFAFAGISPARRPNTPFQRRP